MASPEDPIDFRLGGFEDRPELLDLPLDLTVADVDPESFKRTLIDRREAIIESIHRTYEKTLENFPGYDDSVLPAAKVAILSHRVGERYKNVIEPAAYWANKSGGIFYDIRDIKPKFHPYWAAVSESGFIPEVRIIGSFGRYSTAQLDARIPGTSD